MYIITSLKSYNFFTITTYIFLYSRTERWSTSWYYKPP